MAKITYIETQRTEHVSWTSPSGLPSWKARATTAFPASRPIAAGPVACSTCHVYVHSRLGRQTGGQGKHGRR